MFKLLLPMLMLLNLTIAQADSTDLDRADVDTESVSEIINLFTGESFDLADYSYDRDLDAKAAEYELVSVEVADQNETNEYNVVVTLKRKWEFALHSDIVDTKSLSPSDWRSRIYARDAHRVEQANARYRFNDIISAGPAVLRSTNWVGQLPRGNENPNHKVYIGGNIKIILK